LSNRVYYYVRIKCLGECGWYEARSLRNEGGAGDTAPALPETDSMYIQTDKLQKSDGQNRYVTPNGIRGDLV